MIILTMIKKFIYLQLCLKIAVLTAGITGTTETALFVLEFTGKFDGMGSGIICFIVLNSIALILACHYLMLIRFDTN